MCRDVTYEEIPCVFVCQSFEAFRLPPVEVSLEEGLECGRQTLESFRQEKEESEKLLGMERREALANRVKQRGGVALLTGYIESVTSSCDECICLC